MTFVLPSAAILLLAATALGACPDGKFGSSCSFDCNCANGATCDPQDGSCAGGCADGYWGYGCQLVNTCKYNNDNKNYMASVTRTRSGRLCQEWYKQTPQKHSYGVKAADFPTGDNPSNFCRSPPENGYYYNPWCYTVEGGRWEYCDTKNCDCPDGLFGTGCKSECHCANDAVCDSTSGHCPSGCADGWSGAGCQFNTPDGWVTDAPATFTEAQKRIMVEKHNHYRRMEKSSNMMRLEWDDDLAVFAQNVADRCKFEHTDNSERKNLGVHANAGENIFASSASGFMTQEVVRGWWSEIEDYTFDTQACTKGKMCGHYTQVVWADSKALGCGVSRCDKLEGVPDSWGASYVVFCVYGPAGNFNGRQPFVKGDTCTQCPDGAKECGDGLCSPNAGNTAPVRQEYASANEFCQARQGPDSFVCLQKKLYGNRDPEGDIICKQVFCAKNGNPEDCAYEFASYTDGLPCGTGKVCHHGVCEMDLTGAHDDIQDGCVHGDQGKVYGPTTGGIVTCDAVTAKDGTAACKADTFGRLCCSSCASILKDVDPNCPFGDEYGPGWCKRYESWICNCPTWKKSCCDFCKNRK